MDGPLHTRVQRVRSECATALVRELADNVSLDDFA